MATPCLAPTAAPDPVVTPTVSPLTQATPPIVLEAADLPPTPPAPTAAANLPLERLAILEPGPGSQVTSPFTLMGRGGPSFANRVRVRLIGEDGRVITSRTTFLQTTPGFSGLFITEIAFDISGVAEAARLEVSTDDLRTGRMDHLTTRNLILLAAGSPLIHPTLDGPERLAILSPREGVGIAGGVVHVRGAGWVESDLPLTVAVLDRYQTVLGMVEVPLEAPGLGQLGTFEVDVPYTIPYAQYARLAVYERAPDDSGLIHYSSIEVFLRP
jgi:hypothetical protein